MRTKAEKRNGKKRRRTPAAEAKAAAQASTRRTVVESRLMPAPAWVSPADPWYVVRVHTRREKAAERELAAINFEAWLPRIAMTTVVRGKKLPSEIALFPGYILLKVPDAERAELFHALGKAEDELALGLGFVGVSNGMGHVRPERLPRRFLERLVGRLASGEAPVKAEPQPETVVGNMVRILEGPFASFAGVVERVMPELGRLVVAAELLGRLTPVELELAQVDRV